MRKIVYGLIIILGFQSCNSLDESNPNELLTQYLNYGFDKSYEKRYNLISTDSKGLCSLGEYLKYYDSPDSLKPISSEILSIKELDKDINNPSFKRFKSKTEIITQSNDTIINQYYWTLKNEDNHWRVIWHQTILRQASQKYNDADYEGAIKLYEKAIVLNPYSANAYSKIGWCYYRDMSKSLAESKEQMLKNFKYAVSLEPDIADHYNSLASYYSMINIPDLQIENYKKAIELTLNKNEGSYLYANMSGTYLIEKNYDEALINIKKAISLDSTNTFNWYKYGLILKQTEKNKEAKEQFEKALSFPIMENSLQNGLYQSYSTVCYFLEEYDKAKTYILKALELSPSDKTSILIYDEIKKKQSK
jgi:tetratricopeptide (TPR) repeat protein